MFIYAVVSCQDCTISTLKNGGNTIKKASFFCFSPAGFYSAMLGTGPAITIGILTTSPAQAFSCTGTGGGDGGDWGSLSASGQWCYDGMYVQSYNYDIDENFYWDVTDYDMPYAFDSAEYVHHHHVWELDDDNGTCAVVEFHLILDRSGTDDSDVSTSYFSC